MLPIILDSIDGLKKHSFLPALANRQIFTSNGTFTPVTRVVYLTGCGAGGDGGAYSSFQGLWGGGGAAGTSIFRYPVNVTESVSINITVGSGNTVFGDEITLVKGANGVSYSSGGQGGQYTLFEKSFYGYATVKFGGNGGNGNAASGGYTSGQAGAAITLFELGVTVAGGTGGSNGGGGGSPAFLTSSFFGLTGATGAGGQGGAGGLYGAGASTDALGGKGILIIEW